MAFSCKDLCPPPRRRVVNWQAYHTGQPLRCAESGATPDITYYPSVPQGSPILPPGQALLAPVPVQPCSFLPSGGTHAYLPASNAARYQVLPSVPDAGFGSGNTLATIVDPDEQTNKRFHQGSDYQTNGLSPEGVLQVPVAGTQGGANVHRSTLPRALTSPVYVQEQPYTASMATECGAARRDLKSLEALLNACETDLEETKLSLQEKTLLLEDMQRKKAAAKQNQARTTEVPESEKAKQTQDKTMPLEVEGMKKRIDLLRHERQELIEILMQKERQVAALEGVDYSSKEASALHLGVQAISMIQGNEKLRAKLLKAEAELHTLKADRGRVDELLQETFMKLTDKRKEAAELLEAVSQRDMRVARLEAYMQQKLREMQIQAERSAEKLDQEQANKARVQQELLVSQEQCRMFREKTMSQSETITHMQAEIVRRDTIVQQLEERVRALTDDLKGAHLQLQQVLKGMAAKDAYMQELEVQLRQTDAQRQAAYLAEVSKNRRLALETRIQQDECRATINDKLEKLAAAKQQLLSTESVVRRIKKAACCTEAPESSYRPSSALTSDAPHVHYPVQQPAAVASEPKQLHNRDEPQSGSSTKPVRSVPFSVRSPAGATEHPMAYPDVSYCAARGDKVDEAVAELMKKPEYWPFGAHLCRLGPGTYLCGADEVAMALATDGSVLMKKQGGSTVTLASYLDGLRQGSK